MYMRILSVKKTIIAAALVLSLAVVACDNGGDATAEPTTAADAVESIAAEAEGAVESMAAEVEATAEAVESMAAEAEESIAAEVEDAVESPAA